MTIVDASVLVAYYIVDDAGHGAARRWFGASGRESERLSAPTLVVSEVVGAVRRRTDEVTAARVMQQVRRPGFLDLRVVTAALADRAAESALAMRLRGCDAIYVALARDLDDELVTFDQEQLERAAAAVRVVRPE